MLKAKNDINESLTYSDEIGLGGKIDRELSPARSAGKEGIVYVQNSRVEDEVVAMVQEELGKVSSIYAAETKAVVESPNCESVATRLGNLDSFEDGIGITVET